MRRVVVGVSVEHFGRPCSSDIWSVATESLEIVGGGTRVRVLIADLREFSDPFDNIMGEGALLEPEGW